MQTLVVFLFLAKILEAWAKLNLSAAIDNRIVEVFELPCHDVNGDKVECSQDAFDRFNCCPIQWDEYEGFNSIGDLPKPFKAHFCDPDDPKSCDDFAELVNLNSTFAGRNIQFKCKRINRLEVGIQGGGTQIHIGRCQMESERKKAQKLKFFNISFTDRSKWKNFGPTLGKPCNYDLYEAKNISALYSRFLKCPFDQDYLQREFSKTLEEAYSHPKLLTDLCILSPNLERCELSTTNSKNSPSSKIRIGECKCFTTMHNITRENGRTFVWDFRQATEGRSCGQRAGNPCTFNIRDLIMAGNTTTSPSAAEFYAECNIKGKDVVGRDVLPPFECERDAGCQNQLKPAKTCLSGDDCKCICSESHECIGLGSRLRGAVWILIFGMFLIIKGYWINCLM